MDEITPDIYIGSYEDSQNLELLKEKGIRSILSLIRLSTDIDYSSLNLERREVVELVDGPRNATSSVIHAVNTLSSLVAEASPVLVHCFAGRSRAPSIVACYFIWYREMDYTEAWARISRRRDVFPTRGMKNLHLLRT